MKEIVYNCVENDNTIKLVFNDSGFLDELQVGCVFDLKSGWSVIGLKDLVDCLEKAGFRLVKDDA